MTKTADKVLIVDDEPNIRELLSTALSFVGFEVDQAATGREALSRTDVFRPDAILLDVMLPDLDGFEVCKRLRQEGRKTPVLFLTAKDSSSDKVHGLTLGGDDYVSKPFSLEEVIARVKALLRRTKSSGVQESARLKFADLELDDDRHQVFRGTEEIELSPTEFNLLRYLMLNPNRVLSKAQILDHVWQYDFDGDGAVVETYISYLRKKIDKDHEPLIHTVRGVGYTLKQKTL